MAIQIGGILGDYQVTGVLGSGGMGKVFRVRSLPFALTTASQRRTLVESRESASTMQVLV